MGVSDELPGFVEGGWTSGESMDFGPYDDEHYRGVIYGGPAYGPGGSEVWVWAIEKQSTRRRSYSGEPIWEFDHTSNGPHRERVAASAQDARDACLNFFLRMVLGH